MRDDIPTKAELHDENTRLRALAEARQLVIADLSDAVSRQQVTIARMCRSLEEAHQDVAASIKAHGEALQRLTIASRALATQVAMYEAMRTAHAAAEERATRAEARLAKDGGRSLWQIIWGRA